MQVRVEESGLDGRGTTALLRQLAAMLRTTGFNAAFTARELGLKASERVDLFVIDPQNKFILLLENKAGATHSDRQLTDYRDKYLELVAGNPHLKEYAPIYLALDREYDVDDDGGRPARCVAPPGVRLAQGIRRPGVAARRPWQCFGPTRSELLQPPDRLVEPRERTMH